MKKLDSLNIEQPSTRVKRMSHTKAFFHQKMGLWFAIVLIIGNMIGSGIFLLPTALAPYGTLSIFGWLLTTSGAILLALMFGKLSYMLPRVGGPYAYARFAFGNFIGFLVAWGYWIGVWVGNAAIAITAVGYLSVFIPQLGAPIYSAMVAIVLVWLVTWVNIYDLKYSSTLQLTTTILKILPLLLVGIFGFFFIELHSNEFLKPVSKPYFSSITAVVTLTLWAFIGIESATIPADYIKQPKKNIPKATLIATIITAIIYISSTMAVISLLPVNLLISSNAPFADAMRPLFGNSAYYLFAAAGAIACLGTLNGWILIQGQVSMAAARDHLFPPVFCELNQANLPAKGICIGSLLITLLIIMNFTKKLVVLYQFAILLATLTTLVPYIFCAMALPLILKRKLYQNHLTKKDLIYTLLLSLSTFLYLIWGIYGAGERIVLHGFLLLLLGIPFYVGQQWKLIQKKRK